MNLRDLLALCGARPGEIFQLASIQGGPLLCTCFTFPDECEAGDAWATAQRPRAVYLSPNPIKEKSNKRSSSADVTAARILLIDFDPEKSPDDPEGLDPTKRALCAAAASTVAAATGGLHLDSGRGRQVWVACAPDLDRERLVKQVRAAHEAPGISIDNTWAIQHLMRLPGHPNPRTGEVARVISSFTRTLDAAGAAALGLPEPRVEPEEWKGELPPAAFGPHDASLVQGQVKKVWDDPDFCRDRSRRDALLVLEALRAGILDADACRLLFAMPRSKAREDKRGENYWLATVKWAKKEITREQKLRDAVAAIPGAEASRPENVDLLVDVEDLDPVLYEATLDRLKEEGARLGNLQERIKKAKKRRGPDRGSVQDLEAVLRNAHQEQRSVGWWYRAHEKWVYYSLSEIKATIDDAGCPVSPAVARLMKDAWTLVNEPFQGEELEGRRWNKDAAKLTHPDPKQGPHPMWDQVLRVLGRGLDGAVAASSWCRENGIRDGASYLLAWVASLIQRPEVKLPWLFFYGLENVGKSTLWEALACLFASGFIIANEALENKGGFNGELAGKVLCVVDDLPIHAKMLKRIKPWVTGEFMGIHAKGQTPYTIPNRTHWIQTGNKVSDCPLKRGDTRMTICQVVAAEGADRRPKSEILRLCKEEASAFTWTLKRFVLPPAVDRLGIAMLATADKRDQQAANATSLERWLEESWPDSLAMSDQKLASAFVKQVPAHEAFEWDTARIVSELPARFRSERRIVLAIQKVLEKRLRFRVRTAELLEFFPECRGDWASSISLGIFLKKIRGKPSLGFDLRRTRSQGVSSLRFTRTPTPLSAPEGGVSQVGG